MKKLTQILMLLTMAPAIISCVGDNIGNASPVNTATPQLKQVQQSGILSGIGSLIPEADTAADQIDPKFNLTKCSSDNNVCVTLSKQVGADYMASSNGAFSWVNPNVMVINKGFVIKFGAKGAPKDFHLASIFSENLRNENVGRIHSIDTSACDNLVKKGPDASKGKECSINFDYMGISYSQQTNDVHFQFAGDGQSNLLDFVFQVQNHKIFEQSYANLNDLNANRLGINYMINSTKEEANGSTLTYSSIFTNDGLTNNGLGSMVIPKEKLSESLSTIEVEKSAFLGNTGKLYFNNYHQTSCGQSAVNKDQECSFQFYQNSDDSAGITRYGFLHHKYYQSATSSIQTTYSGQFVIGFGEIQSRDYDLNSTDMHFELSKQNLSDEVHDPLLRPIYNIPLKDFGLQIRYDPKFYIGFQVTDTGIKYAYGDNAGKLRDSLSVKADNIECFTDALYDDGNTESTDPTKTKCGVTVTSNLSNFTPETRSKGPVGFQLYATYTSPTQHKKIEQLVGNVTISNNIEAPSGSYKNVWPISKFDGETLEVYNETNPIQGYSSLDYSGTCDKDSSVSVLNLATWQRGSGSVYMLYPLKCDKLAPRFPAGSYSNSCVSLTYQNGILSGSCEYRNGGEGDQLRMGSLNYARDCSNGSSVSVNNGELICDRHK